MQCIVKGEPYLTREKYPTHTRVLDWTVSPHIMQNTFCKENRQLKAALNDLDSVDRTEIEESCCYFGEVKLVTPFVTHT